MFPACRDSIRDIDGAIDVQLGAPCLLPAFSHNAVHFSPDDSPLLAQAFDCLAVGASPIAVGTRARVPAWLPERCLRPLTSSGRVSESMQRI